MADVAGPRGKERAPWLMATFGWTRIEAAETYVRVGDKRRGAVNAFARLERLNKNCICIAAHGVGSAILDDRQRQAAQLADSRRRPVPRPCPRGVNLSAAIKSSQNLRESAAEWLLQRAGRRRAAVPDGQPATGGLSDARPESRRQRRLEWPKGRPPH